MSIYSVTKEAEAELPNMEANLRSAGNMCYFIKFKYSAFEFIVFISHKKNLLEKK